AHRQPRITTRARGSTDLGTYDIVPSAGSLNAANYQFGNMVNGTLTVTKASLTVTANNASRTYGAANPTFNATYGGFVNGDTAAVDHKTTSLNTSARTSSS